MFVIGLLWFVASDPSEFFPELAELFIRLDQRKTHIIYQINRVNQEYTSTSVVNLRVGVLWRNYTQLRIQYQQVNTNISLAVSVTRLWMVQPDMEYVFGYICALMENTVIFITNKSEFRMLQLNENDVAVHFCTFEVYLEKAKVNLRFPSLFFVEWKTINGKNAVGMVGRKRAVNSQIELNESLNFTTEMLYHRAQRQYLKKESLFHLNLISNSRPDQVKLVGRVVIDLSEIANTSKYASVTTSKLMYCSVDAEISFSLKLIRNVESNIDLNELDRSSFSDLYSFTTPLRNSAKNKLELKDSFPRVEQERRRIKTKLSEREEGTLNMIRNSRKQLKTENILIKDLIEEVNEERSLPHSLPLTEKKPPQVTVSQESNPVTPPNNIKQLNEAQNCENPQDFQIVIFKEKQILEKDLNDHKNKIKKLQKEIRQAMKLFQESENNSELNKSKLLQTEGVINSLKDNQAKIRGIFQQEIQKIKEAGTREQQLLKSGYEADIKILQATIEEQRLKTQDIEATRMEDFQKIMQNNEEMVSKLKHQESFIDQLAQIKQQSLDFHQEKESIIAEINKKQTELTILRQENTELKASNEEMTFAHATQMNQISQELQVKTAVIETLKSQFSLKIKSLQETIQEKTLNHLKDNRGMEAKITQLIVQHEEKLVASAQALAAAKQQIERLVKSNQIGSQALQSTQKECERLTKEIEKLSIIPVNALQSGNLENYQKLKEEHKKLTLELQTLKKSIIFPEDYRKAMEDGLNADLFMITERSQLQEIQISELKLQNATMRQKMDQLVLEHQQLKGSRSQQEQFNLIKEELAYSKQEEARHFQLQLQLEEQISSLKNELESKKIEMQSIQHIKLLVQELKLQITRLNNELQTLKNSHFEHTTPEIELIHIFPVNYDAQQDHVNHRPIENQELPKQDNLHIIHDENLSPSPGKVSCNSQGLGPAEELQHDFERHSFPFEQHGTPLTHEQINKMLSVKEVNGEEMQFLVDEICKLKEEIQELRTAKCYKMSEVSSGNDQAVLSDERIKEIQKLKRMQQYNSALRAEIQALKEQFAFTLQQNSEITKSNETYAQQMTHNDQENKRIIAELEHHIENLQQRNDQQQNKVSIPQETAQFYEKQNLMRELEAKLANLQEQMRIKDELLAEGERNIEENYTIKYELADLKDKYSEIKIALDEREEVINYLEETKEQLSKELEQVAEKSRHSGINMEMKQTLIQKPANEVENTMQEGEHAQLKNEVQALKKELISMNNYNTKLRGLVQDYTNQALSIERTNQQNLAKLSQALTLKKQMENKVSELSFLINGLSLQLQRNKEQVLSLSQEINSLSLRNNETVLCMQDLKNKNEQLNSKLKVFDQSQQAFHKMQSQPSFQKTPQHIKLELQNQALVQSMKTYEAEFQRLSGELQSLQQQYNENTQENLRKQAKISELSSQLQSQKQRLEELTSENRHLIDKIENDVGIEYPQVQIHEVDSFNDVGSISYEKSIIPLYQHSQLERIEKEMLADDRSQQIEELKKQNLTLKKQVAEQSYQKYEYFNNLELANTKVLELQIQIINMKEQIQKLTSLPLQSFNYMTTPIKKPMHYAEHYSKNMRQPSIMYQPRVKGGISDIINPLNEDLPTQSPQKHNFSKNVETRVQTNVQTKVISENQNDLLQKELEILKQQLESEQKLHNQLRQIHNICQKKYELLNSHYENCLEQLEYFKVENGQFTKGKQNINDELYYLKEAYSKLQNQHEALINQYNALIQNGNESPVQVQTNDKQQLSSEEREQYDQRLQSALKNEEKLTNKILHLEENILNLQKSLQENIQFSQANDKISEKLDQLNDLQIMAAQFQQEIEDAKIYKEQLRGENQTLLKEKSELLVIVQEHSHCLQQRAEWQQKLQSIQHLLVNNESKFAQEKQYLENKMLVLNEEKAHLQAEKSAIYQNLKKESSIVMDNQTQQQKARQVQLFSEIQILRNEKLNQMQRVAELEEKLNSDLKLRNQKEAELQQAFIVKEQEVEEVKFINIQLNQELEQVKFSLSEKELQQSNYKSENQKLIQENTSINQEISLLHAKIEEQITLMGEHQHVIQHLRMQLAILEEGKAQGEQLEQLSNQLAAMQEDIAQKIALIEQLKEKLRKAEDELNNARSELLGKDELIKSNEEKLNSVNEELNKTKQEKKEFMSKRISLEMELQSLNSRYLDLENAIKTTNKLSDSKEKSFETLKGQIVLKEQEIAKLAQKIKARENDILTLSKQLDGLKGQNHLNQLKMQQLAQKERMMKETLEIIEKESQKIVESLKNHYESEQQYYRQCIEKERENNRLGVAVTQARQDAENKERILIYEQQKALQLENELQVMKKNSQSELNNSKIVSIEYEKYEKLMQKNEQILNKNRQYLEIISHKSSASIENDKLKRELNEILQKLSEHEQNNAQTKESIDSRVPQLQKQLEQANVQRSKLNEKINGLAKELHEVKQGNVHNNHVSIENLIMQKDKEINILKKGIKQGKESEFCSSIMEPIDNSSISILNQQILNLNREILEKDNELNRLKTQIQMDKKPFSTVKQVKHHIQFDEEKEKLINEIQERERRQEQYKESIKRLKEELQTGRETNQSVPAVNHAESASIEHIGQISHQLHHLCKQIKQLTQKRGNNEESDKLFQAFVQKYDLMEQQFNNLNLQTSLIQQKAKFISKELQKVKSFIIKSQNRGFKQKTELLALIKPCELAASELVNISQTMSEKQSQNFI